MIYLLVRTNRSKLAQIEAVSLQTSLQLILSNHISRNLTLIKPSYISALQQEDGMARFYEPDLSVELDSPFIRDAANKLVRRSYWMDMNDRTLVMVMVNGIGAHLTNDEKRAHLADLKREHLVDQVCIQEILPPDR
jgi:hypothetical protein